MKILMKKVFHDWVRFAWSIILYYNQFSLANNFSAIEDENTASMIRFLWDNTQINVDRHSSWYDTYLGGLEPGSHLRLPRLNTRIISTHLNINSTCIFTPYIVHPFPWHFYLSTFSRHPTKFVSHELTQIFRASKKWKAKPANLHASYNDSSSFFLLILLICAVFSPFFSPMKEVALQNIVIFKSVGRHSSATMKELKVMTVELKEMRKRTQQCYSYWYKSWNMYLYMFSRKLFRTVKSRIQSLLQREDNLCSTHSEPLVQ
jgi:hypothetical protein